MVDMTTLPLDVFAGLRRRRTLYAAGFAGLAACLAVAGAGCSKEAPPPPPPPEVLVVEAIQQDVPVFTELVGQAAGSQDVEIRARVEGFLESVAFKEGTLVSKGQLLYEIDRKPLEAALANAKADLATWQARLTKAQNDIKRFEPLVKQQAVSQRELDDAISMKDTASAQVTAMQATVDKATLDLSYTRITAPIDGLIGTTQVKTGNLVGRGENTLLVTISQIDPIFFKAGIAEAEYLRLARQFQDKTGARSQIPIDLILADGTIHPHKGKFDVVERNIDPTTGTLAVQMTFPNPERLIRPGQYGRARFQTDLRAGALLVPQRAVQELQNLYSLAIVGADNKVTFRNVKVGPRVDSLWVIEEGLKPGEKVIVEGLQRVKDGATVNPKPGPPVKLGGGDAPAAGAGGK
jgi:membrane fusion protein (multidrug efflux system)